MTKQFIAREVREMAKTFGSGDIYCVLHAFADRLEADEKAEPEAWQYLLGGHWYTVGSDEPWRSKGMPLRELYTHPAPADAERLAEALRKVQSWPLADEAIDDNLQAEAHEVDEAVAAYDAHSAQAQPPANTERLAELLRGLEIGPMAAMLSPKKLFAIGAAIAAQAKEAQPPAASLTFATPETEEDVMAYLRIAKLHIKRFREILQAALAAQENPNENQFP